MLNSPLYGQGGPGWDNNEDELDEDVPVDGGVGLLAIGAAAYGLRKIHQKNKNKKR